LTHNAQTTHKTDFLSKRKAPKQRNTVISEPKLLVRVTGLEPFSSRFQAFVIVAESLENQRL
jgi:hypothetical protein